MSDIAAFQHDSAPIAPVRIQKHRISPRIKRAILAIVGGDVATQKDAAALVGVSASWLSTQLNKPNVRAFYERETVETIGKARMTAANRLVRLIHASSEGVAFDASKHVLAIAGIKPAETPTIINNANVLAGYCVDLGGLATASAAAQVIDNTDKST